MAFDDLDADMDNVEQMLKYSVDHVVPGIGKLVGGNQ
jgi:hypothetical protein